MIVSRLLTFRLIRLLFAFALLLIASQFQSATTARDDSKAATVALFRLGGPGGADLIKLDSLTLADESTSQPTGVDPSILGFNVLVSQDGKTLAGRTADWNVVIQRGLGGPVVSRFPLGGQGWLVSLSADGSKLLASFGEYQATWKVFDTATGEETASYSFTWDSSGLWINRFDPVNWKMYGLLRGEWNRHSVSPWLNRERQLRNGEFDYLAPDPKAVWMKRPALVAINLVTGAEIERLELPPDVVNAWLDDPNSSRESLVGSITPALAVSPDGSELAVLNATDDDITLIDAKTLTVKRTLTMTPKSSLVDKLFSMLPLAPQSTSAKFQSGVWRDAAYSADGRHLYVSGWEADIDSMDDAYKGMGLSIVDLEDGTIEAQLFEGMEVLKLGETPDGIVYVTGRSFPGPATQPSEPFIARFDANSQEILATRRLDSWDFLFVPIAEA